MSDPEATSDVRADGRRPNALREITFERGFTMHAPGSVLVSFGNTRVLCTAFVSDGVPRFRVGKGAWLTAEYGMLPGSTNTRHARPISRGKLDGRAVEIQRLIGRSLRAVVDLDQLDEVTITLDCDVLQADGGTRTAAITGAYVALYDALISLKQRERMKYWPLIDSVCAVSVGVVGNTHCLDLPYEEDVRAEVDMNIVMRGNGEFIEVQGTAEGRTFGREALNELLSLAEKGCTELTELQKQALT